MIHPDTKAMLEYLLVMLSVKGEEYTYSYIKKEVLKGISHTKRINKSTRTGTSCLMEYQI